MPLCAFPKCYIPSFLHHGPYSIEWWMREMAETVQLDGVELYGPALPRDQRHLLDIGRNAQSLGLKIPMYCHTPDFAQCGEAARRHEIEEQKRAIETCRRLGISFCRVLSGQRRPDLDPERGLELVASCIQECITFAEQSGVCLVLENHYKDAHWVFPEFAQSRDLFRALLERLPHSAYFGVNFDPSNALVAGEDPVDFLKEFLPRVRTMHASDRYLASGTLEDLRRADAHGRAGYAVNFRHGVIGEGLIRYGEIFSLLKEANFNGWISIENGNDPEKGVEHIDRSARFLRSMMRSHELS